MADPSVILPAHEKYGHPLAFVESGASLVTGGWDGSVRIWSIQDREETSVASGHEKSVNCGAVSAQGTLVTGGTDNLLRVWNLPTLNEVAKLEGHSNTVAGLAAHPTLPIVASASYDSTVRVWGLTDYREWTEFSGHSKNVTSVEFCAGVEEEYVASGGLGDEVIIWSMDSGEPVERLASHGAAVVGLDLSSDNHLWTVSYSGAVRQWATDDWTLGRSFDLPSGGTPSGIAVQPGGSRIAVTKDHGVSVIEPHGALVEEHSTRIKGILSPLWSPSGEFVAVGGADGQIRLYEVE